MESTVAVVVCRIFTSRDTEGLLEEKKKQQEETGKKNQEEQEKQEDLQGENAMIYMHPSITWMQGLPEINDILRQGII